MSTAEELDYSIIICTYNPDEKIFSRCLEAVLQLDRTGVKTEVLLVDNNSTTPLNTVPYIQKYLSTIPGIQYMVEKKQGVGNARVAGIMEARGTFIIYYDDDNEPARDYLQELKKLITRHPCVAAWGPGKIHVDLLGTLDPKLRPHVMPVFQERNMSDVAYACNHDWQTCYPFGTGMCISTAMQKQYVDMVRKGQYTQISRTGKMLTSGEDVQMVLLCIREGNAAGSAPSLRLNHIIPQSRSNFNYLQRLIYWSTLGGATSYLQVFPEKIVDLEKQYVHPKKFVRQTVKKYIKAKFSSQPNEMLLVAHFIATRQGIYNILDKPMPAGVIRILRCMGLVKIIRI